MTRDQALAILKEFTKGESLLKHAYAVEAAMRAYAKKFDEDIEYWGLTGLLHDFDYEMYPDEHPARGNTILKERNVDAPILEAIMGHAAFSGVARSTLLAKTLFAVDELCGFITAVTLVRPSKALSDVKLKSVKKKLKDKHFAARVNRDEIRQGPEEIGLDFDEHVVFVVDALKPVATDLGLNP